MSQPSSPELPSDRPSRPSSDFDASSVEGTAGQRTSGQSTSGQSELQRLDRQLLKLLQARIAILRRLKRETKPPSDAETQNVETLSSGGIHAGGTCSDESLGQDLLANDSIWLDELLAAEKLEGLDAPLLKAWVQHTWSLARQAACERVPIAFLGPLYSYSYLAAAKFFGLGADFVPVTTIAAAFDEIARGHATFAVVPIENNTDGRVVDTLGMFARSPAQICGEVLLPIHHCLLGIGSRADVTEVHSKPQALSQCRHWLAQHLPDVKLVEVSSTAAAAATAATHKGVAAIASREAGIHHGCDVIDENIEDNDQNITRFAVIGNRKCDPTDADKTSLMFQLRHEPGALADAMVAFRNSKVNLTWIESFPLPNRPNEYLFFVELEGHQSSPNIGQAIERLGALAPRIDVLGSYPKAKSESEN